jgi:hypothetical protein
MLLRGSVFADALGAERFSALPTRVRTFHSVTAAPVWTGRADIDGGTHWAARLISWAIGLPRAGRDVPVTVTVDRDVAANGGPPTETWTRDFAGQRFSSRLSATGQGAITEAFGPITFTLGITGNAVGLALPVIGWRIAGVPLPLWLAPQSQSREFADSDGRFHFDVALSLPLVGRLAHYRGWLTERNE